MTIVVDRSINKNKQTINVDYTGLCLYFRATAYIDQMKAWYDIKTKQELVNKTVFSKIQVKNAQRKQWISHLMRLWYFLFSVNSFFKRACAAIQWGKRSDFWWDPSSTSTLHVCEKRKLWWDCEDAQARLSLPWSPISTIILWAGSNVLITVMYIPNIVRFTQNFTAFTFHRVLTIHISPFDGKFSWVGRAENYTF